LTKKASSTNTGRSRSFIKEKIDNISVVITVYNGSRTIADALKSCVAQSQPPAEIIVVDDASTDDTVSIVKKFDFRGIPVQVIESKRNSGGPARPFNNGIACARGPLIATLEQDDVWHPEKLALSRRAFVEFPQAGLVYGDYQAFEKELSPLNEAREGRPQLVSPDEAVKLAMEKQFTLSLSNMAFRKSWWKRTGGLPEKFKICADYNFLARLLSLGCPVAHIPAELFFYRVRPESVWFGSNYVSRNSEKCAAVDHLCRSFPRLADVHLRNQLGLKIFDVAFQAAKSGRCFQAISFYLWSLRYGIAPGKVFRSVARVLVKLVFRKDYE